VTLKLISFLNSSHTASPGIAGSPLDLSKSRVDVTADIGNGRKENFTLLNVFHALNGKLKVLYERRYERDFEDVQWFLSQFPDEIRHFSGNLDEDGLRAFIESLSSEQKQHWMDIFDLSDSENERGSDVGEGSSR
jgi:hypothetical protein